jgi:hypothetical protein
MSAKLPETQKQQGMSQQQHIYQHTFKNGVTATATLSADPPSFAVEWQGKPTRKMFPEYLRWRASIIRDFTERTGKKVLVVNVL